MSSEYTRLILRQGRENERPDVLFRSGEPAYTTDYKRLFIGDDTTLGGLPVGMKFLGFCNFDPNSNNVENVNPGYTGDIIFENSTNLLYVLSGDDFRDKNNYVSINRTPTPDNITLTGINGTLSLIPLSLTFDYFAPFSIGRGLEKFNELVLRIKDAGEGLTFDGSDQLSILDGGVQNKHLAAMDKDTVKGRLGLGGEPEDITLRDLAVSIRPFIEDDGTGGTTLGNPIGTIIDFAGTTPPGGYLICDGSEYSSNEYPELAQVLGTTWGVASVSTFAVPNLMGRGTVGSGQNYFTPTSGISTSVGSYGGSLSIELQRSQIPRHHHDFTINLPGQTGGAFTDSATQRFWGSTDGGPDLGSRNSNFGQPHSNLQPSAVVLKCIKAK